MKYLVWECKIVVAADAEMPQGFDTPPRWAAMAQVEAVTPVISCFSGWGGSLTENEQAVVEMVEKRSARTK